MTSTGRTPASGWTIQAELDVALAVWTSQYPEGTRIDWSRVKAIMDQKGYTFSLSAMSQRWSKKILKQWRSGEDLPDSPHGRKRGRHAGGRKEKDGQEVDEMTSAALDMGDDDPESADCRSAFSQAKRVKTATDDNSDTDHTIDAPIWTGKQEKVAGSNTISARRMTKVEPDFEEVNEAKYEI